MNTESITSLSSEYARSGMYRGAFSVINVWIRRHAEFANNMVSVESDVDCMDEVLVVYSIHEEAKRCFFWTEGSALRYLNEIKISRIPNEKFESLRKTHFRQNKVGESINLNDVELVFALRDPPWDDWSGELFIKTKDKKIVLMWDYCD